MTYQAQNEAENAYQSRTEPTLDGSRNSGERSEAGGCPRYTIRDLRPHPKKGLIRLEDGVSDAEKRQAARANRFILQAVARDILRGERVAICHRWLQNKPGERAEVRLIYSPEHQRAHYGGLMVCGSLWQCPVCASKISTRRTLEIAQAMSAWPGAATMATFTMQHDRDDKLIDLDQLLKGVVRKLKSGRWYQDFSSKYKIAESVTGTEPTCGIANGWHLHQHSLLFLDCAPGEFNGTEAQLELSKRYTALLSAAGGYASLTHGVRIEQAISAQQEAKEKLSGYVSKWGLSDELGRATIKKAGDDGQKHYSPFELLELVLAGDDDLGPGLAAWARARFVEYAHTMKGRKQLVWSKGARALFGLGKEKTEQELAEDLVEVGDVVLAKLSLSQWRVILANDARADLLNVADSGDKIKVHTFLSKFGIRI